MTRFVQSEMHPHRWGSPDAATALPEAARGLIEMAFGIDERPATPAAAPPVGALASDLLDALRSVVGPEHVLVDDETRRLRTRGKSTPDLLRARSGDLSDAPDAVCRPATHEEVAAVLALAVEHHLAVVPFGGGTSVTGGLVARREGYAGLVSLDLVRMKRLLAVDHVSMTATLEPGLRGPEAESLLAEEGLTLGHYPQSFEYATIGGFAATRSSGQSSAGYGRFDAMVVGLRVATPRGELALGSSPANAAGPDLRQVVLGSEGAFGVITAVTVRVRPLPVEKVYEAWSWPSFEAGADAMRALAQGLLLPTVLRLSDEHETAINLARPDEIGGDVDGGVDGDAAGGCVMITGYEGEPAANAAKRAAVTAVLDALGGTCLGETPGQAWAHGRFNAPYLRDSLLDVGVLVETMETATFWSNRDRLYTAVKQALETELGEGTLVLCHISHVYETGCSLYFTVATKEAADPLRQWLAAKAAASDAMMAVGATITHHHAVGSDHRPWLTQEIGELGGSILRAIKADLDPTGILNPGVLIP
ncbi:alkyldihydroxyacetonephosphate synthase [Nocardioides psychrotolerans]|uniref:Alkyldihydroxyacetonephosphate synthase n=1 Tax=Nocardioides psychrotolerans TaxID=1005945 RepID=A0A1I3G8I4_9ACTN|nr:FAD-binding oxidoreductase [Nocardioides psychrotolerans]GEP39948.1 alkyldihydroxyacetonephosphate synthase [Nocardioides psychrotolerans]SFI19808.1 alkyldihydroxyacetonephosphate synthase [Nocardioides psychrotolerans]